ncbi:hypothetical protein PoB_004406800 [Plakobranchus ocellatus]|uniref:Uncharacterized protein n=1 Tax=Plakobranchus ocellatus TaxID=259542 RepID=A0AAV4BFD9_9GAST|nr:hypothetical protein PoB_004406800 [Plakobranchus ocellatus]
MKCYYKGEDPLVLGMKRNCHGAALVSVQGLLLSGYDSIIAGHDMLLSEYSPTFTRYELILIKVWPHPFRSACLGTMGIWNRLSFADTPDLYFREKGRIRKLILSGGMYQITLLVRDIFKRLPNLTNVPVWIAELLSAFA